MMLPLVVLIALGVIVYAYLGFPLLVCLRGWLFPKPWRAEACEPTVTFVIICHNEVAHIGDKLRNLASLDYPSDKLSVVVASDGSSDGTEDAVRSFVDEYAAGGAGGDRHALRVQLLAFPRRGKIPALNDAVGHADGEILIFSDANSQLPADVVRRLTSHFADAEIGGVAGNQVYSDDPNAGVAAGGEQAYWDIDRWLKIAESRAGHAISATGALYAIRKSLFQPVPSGVTDDFTISTRVILQGKRLVFDPRAVACEEVAGKARAEYRRKVRVMTRGLRGVWEVRGLLNPFRFGFYSLQLFSHKVLRRLVAVPLCLLLLLTPGMLLSDGWLWWFGLTQLGFYAAAFLGAVLSNTPLRRLPIFSIPFFFCLVNLAALNAFWNVCRGKRIERWDSSRPSEPSVTGGGSVAGVAAAGKNSP